MLTPLYCRGDSALLMERFINTTVTATLEAQTEHFTVEQRAMYNMLSNNPQREAFILLNPPPVLNTGPLYPVHYYKGEKVLGVPTWKLAWSSVGGGDMADIIDAQSAAIKAGTLTTEQANADWTCKLVHSDDSELDTGDLDTEGARAARKQRDEEYRAKNPRQGNGVNPAAAPRIDLG